MNYSPEELEQLIAMARKGLIKVSAIFWIYLVCLFMSFAAIILPEFGSLTVINLALGIFYAFQVPEYYQKRQELRTLLDELRAELP